MRKIIFSLVFITSTFTFSQETCDSPPEESLEDLNSITKCNIKPSKKSKDKKSRQISVRVSASKKRYLKKRTIVKKAMASSVNNLNVSGISKTDHSSEVDNSLSLANENGLNTITNLTNTLSAEEVRTANRFSNVDKIPLFTSCRGAKKNERVDCFNTQMIKHIQKHFKYPKNAVINKIEGDVWIRFIIDKQGDVTNIKALGPKGCEILDQEAIRVVSKLDKFIPGVKDKENTTVKYGFPITFSLED